jgi:hypothetical protein
MGPKEARQGPRGETSAEIGEQSEGRLALPQHAVNSVVDEAAEILEQFPVLALFRDQEKKTWAITEEKLAEFRTLAEISARPNSNTNEAGPDFPLFDRQSRYNPATSASFNGCGFEVVGLLRDNDYIPALLSPALLRKLGATEYAELSEKSAEESSAEPNYVLETQLDQRFREEVDVLRVQIKPPEGIEVDRAMSGEDLLRDCTKLQSEGIRAGRDKVGQRARVEQLEIQDLHQPDYADIRALTPTQRVFTFSQTDLSGLPLEWLKECPADGKRVILFEDSTQGFALVRDGERSFLHSDNHALQTAIGLRDIAKGDCPADLFDNNLEDFLTNLRRDNSFKLHHLERQLQPGSASEEVSAAARAIISDGSELYVKSTRTAGGQLIVNIRPDELARPRILSDSPEVGDFLFKLAKDASGGKDLPQVLAAYRDKKLACTASLTDFLVALVERMEAPIVERAIPAMRLRTENGDEKIEFRMILQGDDTLEVTGHYAKASLNDVAGNISIGGYGRRTKEAIAGLCKQELGTIYHDERILGKIDETYNQLLSVAGRFGNTFAKSLREDKLGGRNNMRDFAVDICPVWNPEKHSIEFHLLEVQYGYKYAGLTQVEPEMAHNVGDFRVRLEERLRSEAAEAKSRRESRVKMRLFEQLFSGATKDPGSGSAAE